MGRLLLEASWSDEGVRHLPGMLGHLRSVQTLSSALELEGRDLVSAVGQLIVIGRYVSPSS